MTDIAVIILQKDEALHIKRCLERLRPLEPRQVFVVDCFSMDGSDKMAEEMGATVVKHEWPGTQAKQFNWALENLPLDATWTLRIDADEYLTAESISWLASELDNVPGDVNAIEFTLERKFLGGVIRFGTNGIKKIRMFRKGHGRYGDVLMDERILFDGRKLNAPVVFFDDNLSTLEEWKGKHRMYAQRESRQAVARSFPDSRKSIYYKSPRYFRVIVYFCVRYLFLLGFLDGVTGWRWHFWQGLWYRWIVDREIGKLKQAKDRQ